MGDEQAADGDMDGAEVVEGINKDDEPRATGLNVAISTALAESDFGEGIADPVEAYKGRNSSCLWAKKQTFREHPVSSLQSLVLYCAG